MVDTALLWPPEMIEKLFLVCSVVPWPLTEGVVCRSGPLEGHADRATQRNRSGRKLVPDKPLSTFVSAMGISDRAQILGTDSIIRIQRIIWDLCLQI